MLDSIRRILKPAALVLAIVASTLVSQFGSRLGDAANAAQAPAKTLAPNPSAPAIANPHGDIRIACETCHTAESWTAMRKPTRFDHAATGFRLEGKHRTAACKDCHASKVFAHVAASCADCHRDVHEGRNGLRCQDCHVPSRWVDRSDAVRRHASTSFPLRGVHALVECTRCHVGQDEAHVTKVSSECVACHGADYAGAQNPNHAAAGYPTRCEQCHDPARATWTGPGFDHARTGFALTGAHQSQQCTHCHTGGTYTGLPSECYACHQAQYAATQNPNHQQARFGTQCATCHGTTTWAGAVFDHARTSFPLTGAHTSAACTACHATGQYTGTPSDCYACHRTNYEAAQNPNHVVGAFPTTCATCHSTAGWQPASFDHSRTSFPLSGAHTRATCTACHANGQYAGTPTDCYACHRTDYEGTQSPNHVAAGFGPGCAGCHSTTAWQPANFNHDGNYFRIYSGAHARRWSSCAECHTNPSSYRDFSCLSCHAQSNTDEHHREVTGYRYESNACYSCHRGV